MMKDLLRSNKQRKRGMMKDLLRSNKQKCYLKGQNGQSFQITLMTETAAERGRAQTYDSKEPETLEWMRRHIRFGDVLWDVGANVGLYSMFAAKLNARVFAFEPVAGNAARLMQNLHMNQLIGNVDVLPIALSEKSGWGKMHISNLDPGASIHAFQEIHEFSGLDSSYNPATPKPFRQWIYGMTGDELVESNLIPEPAHIKIDVDGGEKEVLRGMTKLFYAASGMKDDLQTYPFKGHLKTVLVECHDNEIEKMTGWMRTYNFEPDLGYPDTSREREKRRAREEGGRWAGHGNLIFKKVDT